MRALARGYFRIFVDREHQATKHYRTRLDFLDVPVVIVGQTVFRAWGSPEPGHLLLPDVVGERFTKREK